MGRSLRGILALCPLLIIIGCTAPAPPPPPSPPTPGAPVAGADGAGDPYYPAAGNGGYDVTNYHVNLGFDPKGDRLDGDTTITANATATLGRFNLDLRGLEVTSVEVNDKPAGFARAGAHELVITPAEPVAVGAFRARVRYQGKPVAPEGGTLGSNGWLRTPSGGVYVMGEPHSAGFWYPVNETPRDKASFRLTARVPDGWTAMSIGRPGPVISRDGWTSYEWDEPNPVASYLTTVAIERFTLEHSTLPDGKPVVSGYGPGADTARVAGGRLPDILDFLSARLGPYPQSAAGGIYLDGGAGYALETQGRPIYSERADVQTVVHENAHQWFGNAVSVRSWADICLNECLASYAQWLWLEAKEGVDLDARYRQQIDRHRPQQGFWAQKLYDMGPGKEFRGVYDKGILAVHALRKLVGEDVFARVLREWTPAHLGGNASWPEFEDFVARLAGRDLRVFFDSWFRGTTIPAEPELYPAKR